MDSTEFVLTAKRIIREKPEVFEALLEFERTKKLPKLNYRRRLNVTIREDILREFRSHSRKHSMNMSLFVERAMREELRKRKS